MSIVIAQVQRANHGRQFHGYGGTCKTPQTA